MKKFGCIKTLYMYDSKTLAFKKNKLYVVKTEFSDGYEFIDELNQDHTIRANYIKRYFLNEKDFLILQRKIKLKKLNKKKF